MRRQTKAKPGLFEKVWPDYPIGLQADPVLQRLPARPGPAQRRPSTTERITEIAPAGVRTADGTVHEADVII